MSDFINKIKEDAKAFSAAVDQELTVLEGVDGYDALRDEDDASDDTDSDNGVEIASDDTEGGGSATEK
ncbi:hypothetical protein GTV32_17960 [Gordonia sp. SID5947]|uniref:hypothetical protein n=1 Tax=Gordonia sp. SID5947 TaxID=2690315 RepID=UPI00136D736D|nr:hypothetical protein [Gordonia sp. SID5947]MYR08070.1 hypothetical protein [Gordonia sp. SID5947]